MTDATIPAPRIFKVMRNTDVSGVSGAGHVADGVLFGDGTTVLRWRSEHRSTAVYQDFEAMRAIHGHDGATTFEFEDARERQEEALLAAVVETFGPDWNEKVAFIRRPGEMREWMRTADFKNAVLKIVGDELGKQCMSAVTQLRSTH